jgi:hypothetical protein
MQSIDLGLRQQDDRPRLGAGELPRPPPRPGKAPPA